MGGGFSAAKRGARHKVREREDTEYSYLNSSRNRTNTDTYSKHITCVEERRNELFRNIIKPCQSPSAHLSSTSKARQLKLQRFQGKDNNTNTKTVENSMYSADMKEHLIYDPGTFEPYCCPVISF